MSKAADLGQDQVEHDGIDRLLRHDRQRFRSVRREQYVETFTFRDCRREATRWRVVSTIKTTNGEAWGSRLIFCG